MTKQEVFDFVVGKVLEQGRPSLNARGDCAYRGENGARCPVGWLLNDETYTEALEGEGVDSLRQAVYRAVRTSVGKVDRDLLGDLQDAHDGAAWIDGAFVSEFKRRATMVAEDHGLSMAVLA